jgi:hypothetical protein
LCLMLISIVGLVDPVCDLTHGLLEAVLPAASLCSDHDSAGYMRDATTVLVLVPVLPTGTCATVPFYL